MNSQMSLIVDGRIVPPPRKVIGFTGTRDGMSMLQMEEFRCRMRSLKENGALILHHGGCIGADHEAHNIAQQVGFVMYVHPSNIKHMQANLRCGTWTTYLKEKKPLDRNIDIVKACDILIATPKTHHEVLRSGTWHTIRKAEEYKKHRVVILPDGRVIEDRFDKPFEVGFVIDNERDT